MGRQDHPSNQRFVPVTPSRTRYFGIKDAGFPDLRGNVVASRPASLEPEPTIESDLLDPTDAAGWADVLAGALEDILFTVSTTTAQDAEEIWRRYCAWVEESWSIDESVAPASPNGSGTESGTPAEGDLAFDPEFDEAILDRLADAITEYIIAVATALKSSTLK